MNPQKTRNPSRPDPEALISLVVVMVMVVRSLLIDQSLDLAKLLHVAGDVDQAVVVEPVLFLRLLQELPETWVVEVVDGDDEALLLIPLPHHDRQTPSRYILQIVLPTVPPMEVNLKHVVVVVVLLAATHGCRRQFEGLIARFKEGNQER
ncbi:unnamed protein product [Cuscuta europaea]|uniref:Uncharacterized protein n=1 Tax=Cuscuta europaea TaxID=41803 RepID=A0A9P0ZTK4_CUSEU|nr:unnamed protein product [Cuscuta europaea]